MTRRGNFTGLCGKAGSDQQKNHQRQQVYRLHHDAGAVFYKIGKKIAGSQHAQRQQIEPCAPAGENGGRNGKNTQLHFSQKDRRSGLVLAEQKQSQIDTGTGQVQFRQARRVNAQTECSLQSMEQERRR